MEILKVDISILSYFDTKLYNSVKSLLNKNYRVFRHYNNQKIKYLSIKKVNTECLLGNTMYKFLNVETNKYEINTLKADNISEIILEHLETKVKVAPTTCCDGCTCAANGQCRPKSQGAGSCGGAATTAGNCIHAYQNGCTPSSPSPPTPSTTPPPTPSTTPPPTPSTTPPPTPSTTPCSDCSSGTFVPTPSPGPTPGPAPSPPIPPADSQRVVGYITSWDHYSHGVYTWPDQVGKNLTHVNYAFATVSYSQTLDTYYVDMADPWADSGDCAGAANCWGQSPECLEIKGDNVNNCGSATSPTVNMAPYIGAGDAGASCNAGCVNNGGSPVSTRTPQCNANLNTFTHPAATPIDPTTQKPTGPAKPLVCGMYNQLLNPKTGVRSKYPNIKFVISIGGWYDSNFFSFAVSEKYRKNFVDSVVKYVVAFGFDGVDFDWEYPAFEHGGEPAPGAPKKNDPESVTDCTIDTCQAPSRKDDAANFAKFLTDLRAGFDLVKGKYPPPAKDLKGEYIISMAGPAGKDKITKLDLKRMCTAMSYINIMTYDMHGTYDAKTNHQSPIYCQTGSANGNPPDFCYSVDNAVQLYIKGGCRPDQLNLGVPFYAHMYDQVSKGPDATLPGLYQNHTGPSEQICQTKPDACVPTWKSQGSKWENMKNWDASSQAIFSYDSADNNFYSYDNLQSIAAKRAYANNKKTGGFMYWFIGADDPTNTLFNALIGSSQNTESTIVNINPQPLYLTTLKDVPPIQLDIGIKAHAYGSTLQSYSYSRRT